MSRRTLVIKHNPGISNLELEELVKKGEAMDAREAASKNATDLRSVVPAPGGQA